MSKYIVINMRDKIEVLARADTIKELRYKLDFVPFEEIEKTLDSKKPKIINDDYWVKIIKDTSYDDETFNVLVSRLINIKNKAKMSYREIASEMEIGNNTALKLLNYQKTVKREALEKLEEYVFFKEKEMELQK